MRLWRGSKDIFLSASQTFLNQQFRDHTAGKSQFNPMNWFYKKEKSTPYETVANATESTQNLSPGRFWHAEVEFDVKNLRIRHPDLEMKENDLPKIYVLIRSPG